MLNAHTITVLFIIAIIIIITIYDFFALFYFGVQYTISDVIRTWGRKWPLLIPLVAFGMGCLFGHFFLCP